ncbi:MAG: hypothetical protein Sapg2KO_11450 [Saprospiraceae bacterium]
MILSVCITGTLSAQKKDKNKDLVQFSGLILDGATDQLIPVPYANVVVEQRNRGTYSDLKGFFTIVVQKGDVVSFSAIGYKTVEYEIPMELEDDRYSIVQLMSQDTFNLPETVVFPWPSKDHFRLEFLAMDVTPELQDIANQNLSAENMERLRPAVTVDGNENADYYLRQQANDYYYNGQMPPMNIFNAVAWKKFFDSWKKGDYKKKSKQ